MVWSILRTSASIEVKSGDAGLMIMASHQTFSSQIKHMSGQIKFGPTNFLYIINQNFMEFAKENKCLDNFQAWLGARKWQFLLASKTWHCQVSSTEVFLCSDYHKKLPNHQLLSLANHVMFYSRLTICQVHLSTLGCQTGSKKRCK